MRLKIRTVDLLVIVLKATDDVVERRWQVLIALTR